ncbi:MAG TPA: phage terminase small subunit P27 family [Bryobacteraceae bacterium]|jgi:P27 family predicted phage terminase small subunit|nr:phage terminase small subunit P27 family [Bryobacteraceae bacterium]
MTKPPSHLTAAGRKLWKNIAAEIDLDAAAVLLLTTMCESLDRMNQAKRILKREGVVFRDRFGQRKAHPACGIERDSAATMTRCWRLLGFDQVPPVEGQ